jgi:hypothetical protein
VCALAAALIAARPTRAAVATPPAVSIWYRGVPDGVPRADDLAEIRALGFSSVTWPIMSVDHVADLRKAADAIGLYVDIRIEPTPLTPESARRPRSHVDIDVSSRSPARANFAALAWRAVAHGASAVAIDPGKTDGTGLTAADGTPAPWLSAAQALARQLDFNARVFAEWKDGPAVTFESAPPADLEVLLKRDERSWYLVATNTGASPAHAVMRLPPDVPAALWLEMIDASMMSMLNEPQGPRWTLDIAPGQGHVYVIDKKR